MITSFAPLSTYLSIFHFIVRIDGRELRRQLASGKIFLDCSIMHEDSCRKLVDVRNVNDEFLIHRERRNTAVNTTHNNRPSRIHFKIQVGRSDLEENIEYKEISRK